MNECHNFVQVALESFSIPFEMLMLIEDNIINIELFQNFDKIISDQIVLSVSLICWLNGWDSSYHIW